jgi:ATP-dependent helicase YprA (DUF1998 family)
MHKLSSAAVIAASLASFGFALFRRQSGRIGRRAPISAGVSRLGCAAAPAGENGASADVAEAN